MAKNARRRPAGGRARGGSLLSLRRACALISWKCDYGRGHRSCWQWCGKNNPWRRWFGIEEERAIFQKKLNFQNEILDKLRKINLSRKSRAQRSHKELSFELWNLCIQKIELCTFCVPRKTRPHQSRLYFLDMRGRQLVQSLGRAGAAWKPEVFRSINAQVEA